MRGRIGHFGIALGAIVACGNATAVTAAKAPVGQCRVTAGSKLSADLNKAICTEVKRAVAEAVPGSRFLVEVTASSSSRLAARLTLDGKVLPTQNFAVMDTRLSLDSIKRFARSLGEVAKASKR